MSLFGFGASSRVREHRAKRDRALCSPIDPASSANLRVTSLAELPRSETALQDGDQDILSSDMAGIVEGIKEKRWTASRVLHCFIRSARRAHERTNCLTEGERPYPTRPCGGAMICTHLSKLSAQLR